MFDKFFEEWKKEYEETTRSLLKKLQQKYEDFWKELVKDLLEKKVNLEQDIVIISRKKTEKMDGLEKVSEEYGIMDKKREKEEKTLATLTELQVEQADLLKTHQEKIQGIEDREKAVELREKKTEEDKLETLAIQADIRERQASVKRAFEKAYGSSKQ